MRRDTRDRSTPRIAAASLMLTDPETALVRLAQRNAGAGLTFVVRRHASITAAARGSACVRGNPLPSPTGWSPGDRRKRGVQLVEDLLDAQVNLVLSQ